MGDVVDAGSVARAVARFVDDTLMSASVSSRLGGSIDGRSLARRDFCGGGARVTTLTGMSGGVHLRTSGIGVGCWSRTSGGASGWIRIWRLGSCASRVATSGIEAGLPPGAGRGAAAAFATGRGTLIPAVCSTTGSGMGTFRTRTV
jgi:hypothetical protein